MKRPQKATPAKPKQITAEALIHEMETEALAYSLEQRKNLRVFLVLRYSNDPDAVEITKHGQAQNLKWVTSRLKRGAQPVGTIVAQDLKPETTARFTKAEWHLKAIWGYPDFGADEGITLLERVRDQILTPAFTYKKRRRK
jgi:hypothetical protein